MNEMESTHSKKAFRVGIYLRLSNEDRNKLNKNDDSESIKNQRNLLMQYMKVHPQFYFVDEYCDEDLSGAGTYRPEFERLIHDCENGKLDIVLCKSQSRFSRDMEIVEKYINNKFIEWNIRFIGLSDNADTEIEGNKKARQINGLVNEWYLEDVSNNIRSAFHSKMLEGEFISPFAPYGYEVAKENNNQLVIDPIASKVVKNIFNLYQMGYGFSTIAQKLNEKTIPSPSLYKYQKGIRLHIVSDKPRENIKWNPNAIKTILTNEVYLGHLIQGKRTTVSYKNHTIKSKRKEEWIRIENTHEKIIDFKTFQEVQAIIKRKRKPIKKTGCPHLFSGKVFCKECNSVMWKKNSKTHEYLVCSNLHSCLNKKGIRYDYLVSLIKERINEKIHKYYDEEILEKYWLTQKNDSFLKLGTSLTKQKEGLEEKQIHVRKCLKNLYEDKVNGVITEEQFKDLITTYNNEENTYKEQIKSINNEISYYKIKEESRKNDKEVFKKYQKLEELNSVIVDEFIDKIYIGKLSVDTNSREIQIKWNFE